MIRLPLSLRVAARAIVRRPLQPLVMIFALSVGFTAVSLVGAALYEAVFRAPDYAQADQLVTVRATGDLLARDDIDVVRNSSVLRRMSVFEEQRQYLQSANDAQRIGTAAVDSAFLPTLGSVVASGRAFVVDDYKYASPPVAILSARLAGHLATTGTVVGSTVVLDGERLTIVGVMPSTFDFPAGTDVWTARRDRSSQEARVFQIIGRLGGSTLSAFEAELRVIARRRTNARLSQPLGYHVERFVEARRNAIAPEFWMAACTVVLLFLLTIATACNVTVARILARDRTTAVKRAMGASMRRLFAEQAGELAMIVSCAAMLAVISALAGRQVGLLEISNSGLAWITTVRSGVVMTIIGVLSLVTLVVLLAFGGLQARGVDIQAVLRSAGLATTERSRRWQTSFIAAEIAFVMFFAITLGVVVRSYAKSSAIRWGYDADNVTFGVVRVPGVKNGSAAARGEIAQGLAEELRSMYGNGAVTVFGSTLPAWSASARQTIAVTGYSGTSRFGPLTPHVTTDVDLAYFNTMGVEIVRGRAIAITDSRGALPVVVIDELLASRNWPGVDPIGKQIKLVDLEPGGPWYTIVGVASQRLEISAASGLFAKRQMHQSIVYRSLAQVGASWPSDTAAIGAGFAFAIAGRGDPRARVARTRLAISKIAPSSSVEFLGALHDYFDAERLVDARRAGLVAAVALFGLLLSVVGVVGLVSDAVTHRRREIGIRIALGARNTQVLGMVLHESTVAACAGVAVGLVGAALIVKVVGHFVVGFGVGIDDPAVLVAGSTTMLLFVLSVTLVPAMRALTIDPAETLRVE